MTQANKSEGQARLVVEECDHCGARVGKVVGSPPGEIVYVLCTKCTEAIKWLNDKTTTL